MVIVSCPDQVVEAKVEEKTGLTKGYVMPFNTVQKYSDMLMKSEIQYFLRCLRESIRRDQGHCWGKLRELM